MNVSFTIFSTKNGANQAEELTFLPSQRFSQFINYSKAMRERTGESSASTAANEPLLDLKYLALARSCENGWGIRQPRPRLIIAACRLMRGVVGKRMEVEGG
jgi:hypothetical protein